LPHWLATAIQASPSTHFWSFAQSILYRGAALDAVWLKFLAVAGIRDFSFGLAIIRLRSVA
jgi:ABC-2 type transport system permease protein